MLSGVLRTIRDGLLTLAYPSNCRVCGGSIESWNDGIACATCWLDQTRTPLFKEPCCQRCGIPLVRRMTPISSAPVANCPECARAPFDSARACGAYAGALEASILFLKTQPHICPRLAHLMFETYNRHRDVLSSDLLIPVPLHPKRLRERGFNQARLIASKLAREFRLPLDDRSLVRTRYTERHRAGLDAVERSKSVSDAFAVRGERVRGRSILLVDDLLTTGSTVGAATAALAKAGATRVNVFTLARIV